MLDLPGLHTIIGFQSRHNMSVPEIKPQFTLIGASVWRTTVLTPLQQSWNWLATRRLNEEQALLSRLGELVRSAIGGKSDIFNSAPLYQMLIGRTMFVHRCSSHRTGYNKIDYGRALLGRPRESLRIIGRDQKIIQLPSDALLKLSLALVIRLQFGAQPVHAISNQYVMQPWCAWLICPS